MSATAEELSANLSASYAEYEKAVASGDNELAEKIKAYGEAQRAALEALKKAPDGLWDNALDVVGEFAASTNRVALSVPDMIPNAINAGLSLAGSDTRIPTLTGAMESTGIQGGFMEPGTARDVVRGAGILPVGAAGLRQVAGRNLAKVGDAALEFAGVGQAAPAKTVAQTVGQEIDLLRGQKGALAAPDAAALDAAGDVTTATTKIDPLTGNIVPYHKGKAAVAVGIEPGLVALIKSSNKETREGMGSVLDALEAGRRNHATAAAIRPLDAVGDSVARRINVVHKANQEAGEATKAVARTLEGEPVNLDAPIRSFLEGLAEEGVVIGRGAEGELIFDFQGSTMESLDAPQNLVKAVVNRLYRTGTVDAWGAHTAKKWLDNIAGYGQASGEGLTKEVKAMAKTLRHNIDEVLDGQFPEYNRVNTTYSETKSVLDDLQSLAGKKTDLTADNADRAMGTLARSMLGNANRGRYFSDTLGNLTTLAKKYAPNQNFEDDILRQVGLADGLERMFGVVQNTGLQGDMSKVMEAAQAATSARDAAFWAAKKIGSKSDAKAYKQRTEAIRRLIRD